MSNQLETLRQLLIQTGETEGRVVLISGDSANVTTSRGVIQANNPGGLELSIGEYVRLEGNAIIGRIRDRSTVPIFDL